MRIQTKLGYFYFDNSVPDSHAKLIADTVTAQWFNPKPTEPRLKTKLDCQNFVLDRCSDRLAIHEFDLTILA